MSNFENTQHGNKNIGTQTEPLYKNKKQLTDISFVDQGDKSELELRQLEESQESEEENMSNIDIEQELNENVYNKVSIPKINSVGNKKEDWSFIVDEDPEFQKIKNSLEQHPEEYKEEFKERKKLNMAGNKEVEKKSLGKPLKKREEKSLINKDTGGELKKEPEKLIKPGYYKVPAPKRILQSDPSKSMNTSISTALPYFWSTGSSISTKATNNWIDLNATVMALDANGNYQSMFYSAWHKLKHEK